MSILYNHINDDAAMKLYNLGMNDFQIGEKLGVTHSTVGKWRKRLGLMSNHKVRKQNCNGCLYWLNSSGCDYGKQERFCHYLLHTNKRRVIGENGECLSYTRRGEPHGTAHA